MSFNPHEFVEEKKHHYDIYSLFQFNIEDQNLIVFIFALIILRKTFHSSVSMIRVSSEFADDLVKIDPKAKTWSKDTTIRKSSKLHP